MPWGALGSSLHILEQGRGHWGKPLFMEIFLLASWNIWKERNIMLLEGVLPSLGYWKARLKIGLQLLVHRTKDSLHSTIHIIVAF
jgi:hypothetical protein